MALTRTVLQAADALTGNGSSADAGGANCVVFVGESAPTGAAGVLTFEVSVDEGTTWSLLAVTDALTGAALAGSATAAARDGFAVIADDGLTGDCLVRARISTNWTTASPLVVAMVQRGS